MISKKSFTRIIKAIEKQSVIDSDIADHLNAIMHESTGSVYSTKMLNSMISILEDEFNDKGQWINFYLSELDREDNEPHAWYKNGDPIKLDTAGDLYDLLVENLAKA